MLINNQPSPTDSAEFVHGGMVTSYSFLSGANAEILSASQSDGSAAWPSANRAIFIPLYLSAPFVVATAFWANGGTASGNIDVGVYDVAGTRLGSIGTTAQSGTSTVQSASLALALAPGVYFLAIAMDNTTGTVRAINIGNTSLLLMEVCGIQQMASAFVLPSTATFANPASAFIPFIGLTSGTVI
jgi:hypothetical protein